MKIDLDWIKKELDAGRRVLLDYVDEETTNKFCSESNIIEVDKVFITGNNKEYEGYIELKEDIIGLLLSKRVLYAEFKYFRIKRNEPTFDDLIDVAVQAQKDGFIEDIFIKRNKNEEFLVTTTDFGYKYKTSDYCSHIKHINSLYTETFVIESVEDIARIKEGATVILFNGSTSYAHHLCSDGLDCGIIVDDRVQFMGFFILKGATVTQKKI